MRIYKKTCNSTMMGISDDELKKRKKGPSPYDSLMFKKVTTYKVWDIFDK